MKNLKFDLQRFATLTVSSADELVLQIAAASDGDTIQMLSDVTVIEWIEISKDITLDLNGTTISTNDDSVFIVTLEGKLTVTDTGTGGTITGDYAIRNYDGTVTINGGTISVENVAIFNNCGVVEISDGTITGDLAIRNIGGTVTINGGTISGKDYAINNNGGTISISGGNQRRHFYSHGFKQ